MRISVIIPVWNGATVIRQCLERLFAHTPPEGLEVICVDNGSADDSRSLIAAGFPVVRLLAQPVNLGFAGGVNVGLRVAQGDYLVLLNQDLLLEPGWAQAMHQVFDAQPACGILGAVILNDDQTVNHTGAHIEHPLVWGKHLTAMPTGDPTPASWPSEYVTGALFAVRRKTWETIGEFDEEFYPAYYEECDYCLRAQAQGFEVRVAHAMRGTHLFSSREWQREPVRHAVNHHRARYRFICKHLTDEQLPQFMTAEQQAAAEETVFDHALGRTAAASHTLRRLAPPFLEQWTAAHPTPPPRLSQDKSRLRQLQVGFGALRVTALERLLRLAMPNGIAHETSAPNTQDAMTDFESWQAQVRLAHARLDEAVALRDAHAEQMQALDRRILAREEESMSPRRSGRSWIAGRLELLSEQAERNQIVDWRQSVALAHANFLRANLLENVFSHRLNLLEQQATRLEYRQRVLELLARYEFD